MPSYKKPLSLATAPSLRQLRAFVAAYQTGQVSAAAEALSLTQPAVTILLRDLESKLGVQLFDRTSRGLRRTTAAVEAFSHVERIISELESFVGSMGELSAVRRGSVRIACTSTVAQTLLPSLVQRFESQHPDVLVEILDVAPLDLTETILSQRADLAIGTLDHRVPGLKEEVFIRDTLSAVGLPGPEFTATGGITWKQLALLPLITVKPGYGVRRRIDAAALEAKVQLHIRHEVSLLMTALALAESGVGIAIVPGSLLAHASGRRAVARRIVRPTVERDISLLTLAERKPSPASEAFRRIVLSKTTQK